jgi:hypothetical protein
VGLAVRRPSIEDGNELRHGRVLSEDVPIGGGPVEERLVTRYPTRSAEDADENQRRVEAVFEELSASRPDTVSYLVLRLADDSFVHLSFHDHGEDEVDPIASAAVFAHFQDGHADRREGGGDQQMATLVGGLHHDDRLTGLALPGEARC